MPAIRLRPQTRFLLLGSALTVALLILWWLVLLNPLLTLLRGAVDACGIVIWSGQATFSVTETRGGGWSFEVPLEATVPPSATNPAPQEIHSIGFDMEHSEVGAFAFGLPVFWALMLAAPGWRRNLRPMLWGTLAMAVLEIALVLVTAELMAHITLARMVRAHDPVGHWFLRYGHALTVNAIPYLMPFVVALGAHRELREQVFDWAGREPVAANVAIPGGNAQSQRLRPKKRAPRRS
jgi:hypothetical protein